jgi:hypothetical protein
MMAAVRTIGSSVFLIVLVLLSGGCAAALVGAGAGTVAYIRGDLEAVVESNIDATYQASVKALGQLEITPTSKAKDALTAKIVGRDADDKKVTIKLARTADNLTKLSIRIGLIGDETKSRIIYEQIKKNLE